MRTLRSQYKQEPLTVDEEIPTVALRHILGSVHVSTPDSEIEKLVLERTEKFSYTPEQTAQTIRAALWLHEENRREYAFVMSGFTAYA